MAVYGDQIPAALEYRPAVRRQRGNIIADDEIARRDGQHAVDINLNVLIMMKPGLKLVVVFHRQIHFATQPDVIGLPTCPNNCTRHTGCAESALAVRPR